MSLGAQAGLGKPVTRTYWAHFEWTSQLESAERLASKYGIARRDTDDFSLESQARAQGALDQGRFDGQVVPIQATQVDADGRRTDTTVTFAVDEVPRETSLEALATSSPWHGRTVYTPPARVRRLPTAPLRS